VMVGAVLRGVGSKLGHLEAIHSFEAMLWSRGKLRNTLVKEHKKLRNALDCSETH
jgi:hypothetical protein